MRNLDSCRYWRCTLCPCKVRNKFLVNFWNRTILLCVPCIVVEVKRPERDGQLERRWIVSPCPPYQSGPKHWGKHGQLSCYRTAIQASAFGFIASVLQKPQYTFFFLLFLSDGSIQAASNIFWSHQCGRRYCCLYAVHPVVNCRAERRSSCWRRKEKSPDRDDRNFVLLRHPKIGFSVLH
jgi:hypothetical protein